jgi:hypothetical protein
MSDLNIRDTFFFASTASITDCISHRHKSDDPTWSPGIVGNAGDGTYIGVEEKGGNWKAIQLGNSAVSQYSYKLTPWI